MLAAVDFKDGKLGIFDSDDKTTEYITPNNLRNVLKSTSIEIQGVVLNESCNPMYTLSGLDVNLLYQNSFAIDHFNVVILKEGDYWGKTFSKRINKPTIAFFDNATSFSKMKYPMGQYITSYYAESLLDHNGGLLLDTSVDAWKVDAPSMRVIQSWIKNQLGI